MKQDKTINDRSLKYTVIKNPEQYDMYCDKVEELLDESAEENKEEIELLTLLIEDFDNRNYPLEPTDPIEILQFLMERHNLAAKDLTDILGIGKATISKMLNHQVGISKKSIALLSNYFKVDASLFHAVPALQTEELT